MKGNSHLLIKGQNPGVQEDFPEDIATQGIDSHEFDVEKTLLQRAGSILNTRRSFHKLYSESQGQIQDKFFQLLRTLPAQHSRRRHHTNIEPVKVLEIKSDGILHNVT